MSGFLLDTDVVSTLSPSRAAAPKHFLEWLRRMDDEGRVFLSVVTIHEIEKGIVLLEQKGATAKARGLRAWLSGLVVAYNDKILGLDASTAAIAGRLEAKAIGEGYDPGMADAMIAGIAEAHDFVVVTRNARHFEAFGVAVSSPDDGVEPEQADR